MGDLPWDARGGVVPPHIVAELDPAYWRRMIVRKRKKTTLKMWAAEAVLKRNKPVDLYRADAIPLDLKEWLDEWWSFLRYTFWF